MAGAPPGWPGRSEAWPADLARRHGLAPALPPASEDEAEPSFVLDGHLGRLAAYLRMLGFDTWYRTDAADDLLARIAAAERRILLTRDRALLQHKIITHGYFVRAVKPREQVREILARLDLHRALHPFTRCQHQER